MIIKVKKTCNEAVIPTKGSKYAAGHDLYACIETGEKKIPAGKTEKIGTGICMEIPEGYFGAVFARSGLATKRGLRPANCVGVIDSDYRGEIIVALHNDSETDEVIHNGDRVAQLAFLPVYSIDFEETDRLDETERGDGGFGSTGITKK